MSQQPTTAPVVPQEGSNGEDQSLVLAPLEMTRLDALTAQAEELIAAKGGLSGSEHLMLLEEWCQTVFGYLVGSILDLGASVHRLADTVARLIDPDVPDTQLNLPAEAEQMMLTFSAARLQGVIGYLTAKPAPSKLIVPPAQ